MTLALLMLSLLSAELEPLEQARAQLSKHDDVAARKTLERAMKLYADQPDKLGEAYLVLGLAWAEGANETRAGQAFSTAVKLNKQLELPKDASPKVVEWWVKAGGRAPASDAPVVAPEPAVVPPPVTKPVEPVVEVITTPPPPGFSRAWAVVPGGVAVVSGVLSGVLLSQAGAKYSELTTGNFPGTAGQQLAMDGKGLQTGGWLLFGTAGVTAVIALILVLTGS